MIKFLVNTCNWIKNCDVARGNQPTGANFPMKIPYTGKISCRFIFTNFVNNFAQSQN